MVGAMNLRALPLVARGLSILAVLTCASLAMAQVHYHDSGHPWKQRARSGPDAEVPGWYYNLGITGMRAELVADEPKSLLIRHVFANSPASGIVRAGDRVVGAGGQPFKEAHLNGYGEEVFGAKGPVGEFATALEAAQDARAQTPGKLALTILRDGTELAVTLDIGTAYGSFGKDYPSNCAKSERIAAELLAYLVQHQGADGSFGNPVHDTFAPLALLSSGDPRYLPAVERCVRHLCAETRASDEEAKASLPNWRYMGAALVLSEYYLATRAAWVLPELQEVHDFIDAGQYLDMSQINPRAKESHPDSFPKGPRDSHGGWGHNPGFEGYGPIAMLTAQGALAYAMMARCGIEIERANHDAAYDFLRRGSGRNGYVWYGDGVGGRDDGWADMGRTGAAAIANFMSPHADATYRDRARLHATVIGRHPQSFPDTHGSPAMGMGYTALGASVDPASFRALMDANRWWFALAQCTDGTYYYQPNRDNAGYGADSRMTASSVTAFMLLIPKRGLVMTGKGAQSATVPPAGRANASRPLKVFILAGQSNMQGHAAISTFDAMAGDPKTAALLKKMRGADGAPRVCERTWISSVGCLGDAYADLTEAKGRLTAGFGAPEGKIGPEFTFGITMEERLGEDVLLIKTSWGGRSLHTDFRPPSAGPFKWRAGELTERATRGEDAEKLAAEKLAATGVYYREMIAHVRKVLADIPRVVPDFDEARGYELAGLVWFQGFSDYVDGGVYPEQDMQDGYDLYAELLGHFIRDVRADLAAPKLPFVIGVMGIDGMRGDTAAPMRNFREAQRKVAKLDEFKGSVMAVETAPFWDDELERLVERSERSKNLEADFTPEERKRLAGASNGGYHYLGAAKILAPIGQAFAEALLGAKSARTP
jgi:alpha-galactosidase